MEENIQHFWHTMLYYFKKGENTTEEQKMICAVYGESAVTDRNVSKVVCEVSCQRFSPDDAPWSCRPIEVDSNQIETLSENNEHYTVWEIVDILKYPNQ